MTKYYSDNNIGGGPLVSIVVPVYNCEDTISETIESVIFQTYPNWEMICVDDGSTDEGDGIIEKYCKEDNRIRFIRRNRLPKGGSVCRNIGAFEAKGDYLIFLDGDDLLTNTCIENRLKSIENSQYDFVVFPMASFKDDPKQAVKCSRTDVKNMKYYFASAQGGWQVTSPIFRMPFFRGINGFNESFPRLQDIEMHFRAIIASKGNYLVKDEAQPDCLYRMGEHHYSEQKIISGLTAHHLFFHLLKDNIESLSNPRNRSIALLNNFCSVFIGFNILETHHKGAVALDEIVDDSLLVFLSPLHKFIFRVFKNIFPYKVGLVLIRSCRKLLLQKFIKFE